MYRSHHGPDRPDANTGQWSIVLDGGLACVSASVQGSRQGSVEQASKTYATQKAPPPPPPKRKSIELGSSSSSDQAVHRGHGKEKGSKSGVRNPPFWRGISQPTPCLVNR